MDTMRRHTRTLLVLALFCIAPLAFPHTASAQYTSFQTPLTTGYIYFQPGPGDNIIGGVCNSYGLPGVLFLYLDDPVR